MAECENIPTPPDPYQYGLHEWIRRDGTVSMDEPLRLTPGAPNKPSLANLADPRDGIYFAENQIGFAIDGLTKFLIGLSGIYIQIGAFSTLFTHSNTANRTIIVPDEDGTMETREHNLVKLYLVTRWY